MAENEQAFFYEVCNLWNNEGPVSKNLQAFFIFSYTKGDNYFKVPNLSMKIKTKSEYDNTEVKAFVSYETLPVLINSLQEHIHSDPIPGSSIQYGGHTFTYSISVVDENKSKLKITNSDGISNDIIMYRGRVSDLARTLRITYDNIITISLNFIKLSQNSEILDRLNSIESTVRKLISSNNIIDNSNIEVEQVKEPFQGFDNVQVTPIPNAIPEQVQEQVPIPNAEPTSTRTMLLDGQPIDNSNSQQPIQNIVEEPPTPNVDISIDGYTDETRPPWLDKPINDLDNFSVDTNVNNNPPVPNLQEALNTIVQSKVNEPTYKTLMDKVTSLMTDAFNKKINVEDLLNATIKEFALLTSANINGKLIETFEDMSNFFNVSYASFRLYMSKLIFLVEHYNQIDPNTKIPMFIMRVRFPNMYIDTTKDLNIALVMLYEITRNKVAQPDATELDRFSLACLRYIYSPFWSSYLNVADISNFESALVPKLKNTTSKFLVNWEETFMSNLDTFIYNAKLAFDFKSVSNIEKLFSQYCPTIDYCLNNNDNQTIEDVVEVNKIISTLKNTYSCEDVNWKSNVYNKLSDNFINCVLTFSKKNNIDENTSESDIIAILTTVVSQNNNNKRELIKAMENVDSNDGEMKVLTAQ